MNLRHFFAVSTLAICGLAFVVDFAGAAPMVSDPNLLSGLAATPANINVSSVASSDYLPQNATNGTGGGVGKDFVFAIGDPDERLAITGFNSALGDIRVWTSSDLAPAHITIYSSNTSQTSLQSSDYSLLVPTVAPPTWIAGTDASAGLEYADFVVNAPVGTQSLFFDFGATNSGNPQYAGFVRIAELQAFAPVPEPSSVVALCGLGAMGLFLFVRRRRKA